MNAKWEFFIRIVMLAAVVNEFSGAPYGRYKLSNCEYFFYWIFRSCLIDINSVRFQQIQKSHQNNNLYW